jgi:prepilin-type N-terminal cleavage/methylation domain-containing protein
MSSPAQKQKGFTLIELLLVIGIIAILAAIVIVAINPTKQLADARDAQRNSDVNSILNAIGQYLIDNSGNMPCSPGGTCVDTTWRMLGTQTVGCNENLVCNVSGLPVACLELRSLSGTYLVTIPSDPRYGSGNGLVVNSKTMYIVKQQDGRVSVKSCSMENSTGAVVTR